jgi:hypothetical protein
MVPLHGAEAKGVLRGEDADVCGEREHDGEKREISLRARRIRGTH